MRTTRKSVIRCQYADREREMGNSIRNARRNEEYSNRMRQRVEQN